VRETAAAVQGAPAELCGQRALMLSHLITLMALMKRKTGQPNKPMGKSVLGYTYTEH